MGRNMHSFVYRLVERLTAEGPPLSRNRHFHTFVTPEGREALRIARHLRSVARDIAAAPEQPVVEKEEGRIRVEIPVRAGVRTAWLERDEYRLLLKMPSVRGTLGELG